MVDHRLCLPKRAWASSSPPNWLTEKEVDEVISFDGTPHTDQELKEEIDYLETNTNISFMNAKMKQYALYERLNTYKSIYLSGRTSNVARKGFSTWFDEFLRIVLK